MSILNPDYDKIDRQLEKWKEIYRFFKGKMLSVLIEDPDNEIRLEGAKTENPGRRLKYIDMSRCAEGDYGLIMATLGTRLFDGVLLDNIDAIGNIADKDYLEELVRFALKREEVPFKDHLVEFDKMMVACRCRKFPEYLRGHSLMMYIVECAKPE